MRPMLAPMTVAVLVACTSSSGQDPAGGPGAQTTSVNDTAGQTTSAAAPAVTPSATPTATAATSSEPAPPPTADPRTGTGPPGVDEVVPGVSIGPVKLGMTRAELDKLGLWVRPARGMEDAERLLDVGPYYVVLDRGRVSSIESTVTKMPKGLKIRGKVLPWRTKFLDVAAAFEGCEPMVRGLCGNWFRCEGKRLYVKGGCGSGVVHVQIFAEPQIEPWEEARPDAGAE